MPANTLHDWFETPLGQYLLEKERAYLDDVTPDVFGFHALQLGVPEVDLMRASRIAHRLRIAAHDHPDVFAKSHELPIATQSIDMVVLPHALEFAADPHGILREVDRVMMPEGRLVIVGFNPWSLWGLRSGIGLSRNEYPWNGNFVSLLRVKDWLGPSWASTSPRAASWPTRRLSTMRECAGASVSWSPQATAGGPWAVPSTCCRPSSACGACACLRPRGRSRRTRARSNLPGPSARASTT